MVAERSLIEAPTMDEDAARRIERLRHEHALSEGLLNATAAWEHGALRPFYILNGGAIAIFVALFAQLISNDNSSDLINRSFGITAILFWAIGLIFATAASALGYFSQLAFRKARDYKIEYNTCVDTRGQHCPGIEQLHKIFTELGFVRRTWSYISTLLSLVTFLSGSLNSVISISSDLFPANIWDINFIFFFLGSMAIALFVFQFLKHLWRKCMAQKGEHVCTPPIFGESNCDPRRRGWVPLLKAADTLARLRKPRTPA